MSFKLIKLNENGKGCHFQNKWWQWWWWWWDLIDISSSNIWIALCMSYKYTCHFMSSIINSVFSHTYITNKSTTYISLQQSFISIRFCFYKIFWFTRSFHSICPIITWQKVIGDCLLWSLVHVTLAYISCSIEWHLVLYTEILKFNITIIILLSSQLLLLTHFIQNIIAIKWHNIVNSNIITG